jgi:hypothetical protein
MINKTFFICGLLIIIFILYYLNNNKNKDNIDKKNKKNHIDNIDKNDNINKKDTINKKDNIQKGGEDFTNCTLEEVLKHNLEDNKWIYINGTIYDITFVINDNLEQSLPTLFKNINPTNVRSVVTLIKYSDLQDLYKIFKSVGDFNNHVNEYNSNEKNTVKAEEFITDNIDSSKDSITQINEKFNKFKLVFLISIKQFEKGVICPAGLTI